MHHTHNAQLSEEVLKTDVSSKFLDGHTFILPQATIHCPSHSLEGVSMDEGRGSEIDLTNLLSFL